LKQKCDLERFKRPIIVFSERERVESQCKMRKRVVIGLLSFGPPSNMGDGLVAVVGCQIILLILGHVGRK